ncbi:uncharacterized protein [Cherax quadricarinatus]|uniref:uncharacterized protein n=1 Tax=Cherax quadricarinatus TaxID=27406 RepID=UPI002378D8B2|nr:uncharacterized protein LOC128685878 [Cherax quadricarinatus]
MYTLLVVLVFGLQVTILDSASVPSSSLRKSVTVQHEGDVLDTPEWLQKIPEESKVAKYRKRRFFSFPTGSSFFIRTTIRIAVAGFGISNGLAIASTSFFYLPNDTRINFGRSMEAMEQRLDFYHQAEQFLDSLGFDGHACALRTICEVAETPFQQGLFGEVVNLMLSVTSSFSDVGNSVDNEYTTAEYYGRVHGSCHAIYPQCPVSFTDIFTSIIPIY